VTFAAWTGALPPSPVAGHDAVRTVATTIEAAGAVTLMIALPA
jgi:hypothetical protein